MLSDLSHLVGGGDITMVSIAKAFSTIAGGPDLSFVDTIAAVRQLHQQPPDRHDHVSHPDRLVQPRRGDRAERHRDARQHRRASFERQDSAASGCDTAALGALDGKDIRRHRLDIRRGRWRSLDRRQAGEGRLQRSRCSSKPASLFNLLLGGDVDLVKFDSGPLTLGFDWRQEFGPVYAPPPVLITLHGSASVTMHIVAGFDTYGIRKAFEAVRDGTLDFGTIGDAILQSLFFYTNDANGKPMPVVSFTGEIAAGAEVSVVHHHRRHRRRRRVDSVVPMERSEPRRQVPHQRVPRDRAEQPDLPVHASRVESVVFLKAYITIGFGPFSVSFSFTIVERDTARLQRDSELSRRHRRNWAV